MSACQPWSQLSGSY